MTTAELYANIVAATGWTIAEVGEVTPRQAHDLCPELFRIASGREKDDGPGWRYDAAVKAAGVEDRVK